jgi:hypothetical protein
MKFTYEELYEMAISEYAMADFLLDGEAGFSQREGLRGWAFLSEEDEYDSEEQVRQEIRQYIKEDKLMSENV